MNRWSTGICAIGLGFSVACSSPDTLRSFQSDGCTFFLDGTLHNPDAWKESCVAHDWSYWRGGTVEERKKADMRLREGIRESGYPLTAGLVYTGVRLLGSPCLPTPWRWGYGWGYPRGYGELSEEEEGQVAFLEQRL